MALELGSVLNQHYRIIAVIASQADEAVYAASDLTGNRLLIAALPIASHEALKHQIETCERIRSLSIDGLLPLKDYFSSSTTLYLVCPHPEGQPLDRTSVASQSQSLEQIESLLSTLTRLHRQRPALFLGDFEASDLWSSAEYGPQLTPFALVRIPGTNPSAYRAPELYDSQRRPDFSSDLYTVGAIWYRLSTAQAPVSAVERQAGAELHAPSALDPALSHASEKVLLRSLELKPSKRYPSAEAMGKALKQSKQERVQPSNFSSNPINGCLIGAIGLLSLGALILIIVSILLVLGPGRELVGSYLAPSPTAPLSSNLESKPTSSPLLQPSSNPNAISILTTDRLTETQALTESIVGPISYNHAGDLIAIGLGNTITLRSSSSYALDRSFSGQTSDLSSLSFSPDDRLLAAGSLGDGVIRLWNVSDGSLIRSINAHPSTVLALAFSPDGSTLASGGKNGSIKLWKLDDGSQIAELTGHSGPISQLAFSPDGSLLASSSHDGTLRLWKPIDRQFEILFQTAINPNSPANLPYQIGSLAFSGDGKLIAAGAGDLVVRVWQLANRVQPLSLRGHSDRPTSLAFAPNGKTLASSALDGVIFLWDPISGAERGKLSNDGLQIKAVAYSPDGRSIASSSAELNRVTFWDAQQQTIRQSLDLGQGLVTSLAYSNTSEQLASSSINGTVRLYRLDDGARLDLIGGSPSSQALAFLPSNQLVSLSDRGNVLVNDLGQKKQTRTLAGLTGPAISLAISPSGNSIAAGTLHGQLVLWNADSFEVIHNLTFEQDSLYTMSFSSDGGLLAIASNGSTPAIRLIDVSSGQQVGSLIGHQGSIVALAAQPKGSLLASASSDGSVRIWSLESQTTVEYLSVAKQEGWINSLAFSPDGTLLVAGSVNGTLVFWDITHSEILRMFDYGAAGSILKLAFRPDSEQLAMSLRDGSVRLVELIRP
jgi:WD40 repeat protein